MATTKSLKAQNIKWLVSITALDIVGLLLLAYPSIDLMKGNPGVATMRASLNAAAPALVLLLVSFLPGTIKDIIVFFRVRDTLPGHRAFTVHAMNDPRIDIEALKKNIGELPAIGREQNALWYKLYRKVEGEGRVSEAHRRYLLFRDLAALSLLLAPIAPLLLYYLGVPHKSVWWSSAILSIQYGVAAIAARNSGVRFVTNVLAIYSTEGSTMPRRSPKKKKSLPADGSE